MRKKDKIETVKDLLTDTKNEVLKASEIKFLQSRGIDINLPFTAPLMIFSGDSESKAKIIKSIALKLNCPVIRIVKAKVINKAPGIVTAPEQKETRIIPAFAKQEPETVAPKRVNILEPEPEEIEAVIRPGRKYKLSFPSVWDGMEDDESMILRLN
ncbi:MAG TPA: hypothetical protein VMV47_11380 [Bacteroidales bacterium]|nr:hypothetical protein [Bacteroidales bacterium]